MGIRFGNRCHIEVEMESVPDGLDRPGNASAAEQNIDFHLTDR